MAVLSYLFGFGDADFIVEIKSDVANAGDDASEVDVVITGF